jgi:5-methylthioadenosine/S-adenosylhomocysteine deaminase
MLKEPSDMHITARWIVPMTGAGELLEEHALVMRDGRILDVLPSSVAAVRYSPRVSLQRPSHLLMPGLVNARTRIAPHFYDAARAGYDAARAGYDAARPGYDAARPGYDAARPGFDAARAGYDAPLAGSDAARAGAALHFHEEGALLAIANLLRGGVTAFCDIGYFPSEVARIAAHQGLRAVIGLPVDDEPSPWAQEPAEYLTRAIKLRDEYKGHPSISTAFAPLRVHALDGATLARIGTLAAELDAGVLASIHGSPQAVAECRARYGSRPLARLERAGLLTPALGASHLARLEADEIELARRAGIGVVLCLASELLRGGGLPALDALSPLRTALGTDAETCGPAYDLWSEIRLFALHAAGASNPAAALAAATRGGAAVLGLDAEVGTLEPGKWADVCCVDLAAPGAHAPGDPLRQLALAGGRDWVSDVWVAGRHLLSEGQFTRLDWAALTARLRETA